MTDVTFTDLDQIQPKYRGAASESAKRGLINGYPDDSFGPTNGLKRSEAATVIARMMEIKGDKVFLQVPKPGFEWDNGNLYVLGSAAAFEANVNFRLRDVDGEEIFEATLRRLTAWAGVRSAYVWMLASSPARIPEPLRCI